MKQVRINVGKVGVVTKKGDYSRVLSAGTYWLGFSEELTMYDMGKIYTSTLDLNIMLKDEAFREMVEVVEVRDHEIALKFENGNFTSVFHPGRYFYWKGLLNIQFVKADLSKVEITEPISRSVLQKGGVSPHTRVFPVQSYEEGLLFVDGKFERKLSKGTYYFWKNAISVEVLKADLRQLQMEISGQEILTKDKAALRVNFYTQYKVTDAEKALLDSRDFEKQLYILMQLALREFIGTMTLDELLDSKEAVGEYVAKAMETKAAKLGVVILSCGIRDVILPGEVKDIMNQVLVAQKQAQANTITRREETASTRSLLNTAKLMEDNTMLFKLKEMEYMEKIADRIGEITVSGGGQVLDQLRDILISKK